VAYQILKIVQADASEVDRHTYYLGDVPIDSYIWLNAMSKGLRGKEIRRVPSDLFVIPALAGDLLVKYGIRSPLYTARFRNMIEDYPAPTERTVAAFGVSHPSLEDNANETIEWMKSEGRDIFDYWRHRTGRGAAEPTRAGG
jgi:hypothetical protein